MGGKKVVLFGSYGWGGTWLDDWAERVKGAGATLAADNVAVFCTPDDEDTARCEAQGKALAEA